MIGHKNWIDYAAVNRRITSRDYTGRTIQAAQALFLAGTHPKLALIAVDDAEFEEYIYWEAAVEAAQHYGEDTMPAWWEGVSKSGVRFVGAIDPDTQEPFMVVPNPSDMGVRFVEPALRDLGADMNEVAYDVMLGFFINLWDSAVLEWVQQLASGAGGQVGQTFVLTPEDVAAHGFLTRNSDLVPGVLMIGPYGTCDIHAEDLYTAFDILVELYVEKGVLDADEAEASMGRLWASIEDRERRFHQAEYDALPDNGTWKDRLFPNRQGKAALSIARKLCP